jgi:hypothetical protein
VVLPFSPCSLLLVICSNLQLLLCKEVMQALLHMVLQLQLHNPVLSNNSRWPGLSKHLSRELSRQTIHKALMVELPLV